MSENKPLRPLTETLTAKVVVYDGDRYLFTMGVASEFEKQQPYDRSTIHDGLMEYLLQKSQGWKERIKLPAAEKAEYGQTIPAAAATTPSPKKTLEDVKKVFSKDLVDLLTFEQTADGVIIRARQFLGSENFAKIASVVRGIGGDYVSAGKASHFRIPMSTQEKAPAQILSPPEIPQIDIGELDECEWLTFKKEPARAGQAAWAKNPIEFTSWKDPPNVLLELAKAMKRSSDEKLVLGDMEYSFSGKGDMAKHFISRKPVKAESAK